MTLTDLANQALLKCGESELITDIAAATHPAVMINTLLPVCLKHVQGAINWPELLAEDEPDMEDTQSFDALNQFELPSDCLRVIKITDTLLTNYDASLEYSWRLEGAYLLTSLTAPRLHYVAYSEDPDDWSNELTEAIIVYLASQIAFPLIQNDKAAASLRAEYEQLVKSQLFSRRKQYSASSQQRGRWFNWRKSRGSY